NSRLCREHFRLVLGLPWFPRTEPGQFVQVSCRGMEQDEAAREREVEWPSGCLPRLAGDEVAGPLAFLRRPFSLAARRDVARGVELDLIHRVVGVGTDWLARLVVADTVGVLGPLGNRFAIPPPGATAILVGGGVGIPPMLYLAEKLAGRPAVAFCGAVTKDLVPLTLAADATHPSADDAEPRMTVGEFS